MPMIDTSDNVRLYAKTWGSGPPVVLIHGWPLSSDSWDPQINALADAGFQVIAYDRRGFGRSEQPDGEYDYDRLADDLADVMEYFSIYADATLVGFSMGGGEVARYLSRHGTAKVARVALVSSVVPYLLLTDTNPHGVDKSVFATMDEGMREDRPHFMAGFFQTFFGQGLLLKTVSSETLDWAWHMAMQAGLRPTLACANAFSTTDFRPDLASFTVPTLIIHGTADKTVPIDPTGRAVAAAVPQSTLIEYDGEPHGLFVTQSKRLSHDLISFARGEAAAVDAIDTGPTAMMTEAMMHTATL